MTITETNCTDSDTGDMTTTVTVTTSRSTEAITSPDLTTQASMFKPVTSQSTQTRAHDNNQTGQMTSQPAETQAPDNSWTTTVFRRMTSQPAQALAPENTTGLIAAVITIIIVLLGVMIVLVVIVLLMKKRYNKIMKELYFFSTLFLVCAESSKGQNSVHLKWLATCKTRNQNQQLRWLTRNQNQQLRWLLS